MAAKRAKRGGEWIGGVAAMPGYVTGEGEPFRPEVLLWLNAEGAIVGTAIEKPGELLAKASASFDEAMKRPMFGNPEVPAKIRVASPELAGVLRASHPAIEVVCAPTPELDGAMAAMRATMGARGAEDEAFDEEEYAAGAMAAFYAAAAALFRARPWDATPDDRAVFGVTIEALDLRDAVVTAIGKMGESRGLLLFRSADDFDVFCQAAVAMRGGTKPRLPWHLALSFERASELPMAVRKEITKRGWEIAGPEAFPDPLAIDEDAVARPPTPKELATLEALARAFPPALADQGALDEAWGGGEPFVRTLHVTTHAGSMDVTIRTPVVERTVRPAREILTELAALDAPDCYDPSLCNALDDELLDAFDASPEAAPLAGLEMCEYLMGFAQRFFRATIAKVGPRELNEIVFDIFPRKVMIDAKVARPYIEQLRAFYAFLKREGGLAQADACLAVLHGDAVEDLRAALADDGGFGEEMALIAAGKKAGYDMSSEEGIRAFLAATRTNQVPRSVPAGGVRAPTKVDKAAANAKKAKRKAERGARRKNR